MKENKLKGVKKVKQSNKKKNEKKPVKNSKTKKKLYDLR